MVKYANYLWKHQKETSLESFMDLTQQRVMAVEMDLILLRIVSYLDPWILANTLKRT